jgi:hypothetical protein
MLTLTLFFSRRCISGGGILGATVFFKNLKKIYKLKKKSNFVG